jgi:hypothetical protein
MARKSGHQGGEIAPAWMKSYGGLAHISGEIERMQREIDETFGVIDEEEWK